MTFRLQHGLEHEAKSHASHTQRAQVKERDDGKPLRGVIQLDDVYWGGERRGGKRGRGSENKTPFVPEGINGGCRVGR